MARTRATALTAQIRGRSGEANDQIGENDDGYEAADKPEKDAQFIEPKRRDELIRE